MPVYAIAQGRVEDRAMLDRYLAAVMPTIVAGGGRILGYEENPEVVEGTVAYPRTVILEFESAEAFRAWYDSDAYQAILPFRLGSTPGSLILLRGLPAR